MMLYFAFIWVLQALPAIVNAQCVCDAVYVKDNSGCRCCRPQPMVKGKYLLDSINRKQPVQNNKPNRYKYANGDGTSKEPVVKWRTVTDNSYSRRNNPEKTYLDYLDGDEQKYGTNKTGGVLDGIYVQEHVPTKKIINYRPTCQWELKDTVVWQKRIWRSIQSTDKFNKVFFEHEFSKDKLADVIAGALIMWPDTLQAYAYNDSLRNIFSKQMSNALAYDLIHEREIVSWKLVEDWYFDKVRSLMDVKIIGICPIIKSGDETKELFWIYFPQLETMLKRAKLNTNFGENYYELFWKRRFKSIIIKESNVVDRLWSPEKDMPASFKK